MDFKVLIADGALADLKEIVEFIAEDNREAAIRLGEKLVAHASSLSTMPERFPFHDKRRGYAICHCRLSSSFTSAMRPPPS